MSLVAPAGFDRASILTRARVELAGDLIRYGASSAAALALDYGLLVGLNRGLGLHYLVAAAIGFLGGLMLAYVLSVTFVFRGRRKLRARQEFAGFAAIGAAGLALTQILLLVLVGGLAFRVEEAKPVTALVVFCFNFSLRRAALFRSGCAGTARNMV
jgi:putative flippase GtrA